MVNLNSLLNSHKILFHFASILNEYRSGEINFNPIAVEIHPTSKCNHRCIHCSYKTRNEKRLELPSEIMDKLITSIINMGVKAVYFSGGGEPAVYPNLKTYIERLYHKGIETSLITNGTYLEESGIIKMAHMLNYVAVSVPSVNSDIFERITKSNKLNKVLAVANTIKSIHRDNAPIVGARIVITNLIYREVLNILETLKHYRYDYALFKLVRDYENRGLGLGEEEEQYLKALIDKSEFDESFTNINKLFDFKKREFYGEKCIVNDAGMIANIDADGKVYPNIVEIGDASFCIGDLTLSDLEDIWNGDTHLKVKRLSHIKWKNNECINCRAITYNNIINDLLHKLPVKYDPFI